MKSLLDARRQRVLNRPRGSWTPREPGLDVARQSADHQNRDHEKDRADENQELWPTPHRDQIKRRIGAAENQHLAKIFQREEGNERNRGPEGQQRQNKIRKESE